MYAVNVWVVLFLFFLGWLNESFNLILINVINSKCCNIIIIYIGLLYKYNG